VVNEKRPLSPDAVVSGFFVGSHKTRGYHPPLVNVEATDTDKRNALALCLLGEHPSGQRQVGLDKSAALKSGSLDKRELLSPVNNTVDNLPTGPRLGWMLYAIKKLNERNKHDPGTSTKDIGTTKGRAGAI